MTSRKTNWAALLIGLVVLLAATAAMVLNPANVTGGIHGFEYETLRRLFPSATNVSTAAPLVATTNANVSAAPWLANAAVLWPELLFVLVAGLVIVALLGRYRTVLAGLFTVLAIAAALAVDWLLFTRPHFFVPVVAACFVLALTFALGLLAAGLQPALRTTPVPAATNGAAVLPEDVEPAAAALPEIHGERRTISCLVCRLAGLGGLAERIEPDGLVRLAREVTVPVKSAISACGGTIASTSGDTFVVTWNALREEADAATHACDAALRISAAVRELQDQHGEGTPYERLHVEIGVATGPAVISGDGSQRSPVLTFGACFARAEQLSALCSRYGTVILIDRATRDAVEGGFAVLEVDTVADAAGAAAIYALYGNPVVRASPRFQALSICNDHLFRAVRERRWQDARTIGAECRKLSGAIPALYDRQLARFDWYEQHPPPDNWDGAFRPPIV